MNEELKNTEPVQMKARSIRASEDVFIKFKELSESFGSQGDCLEQLITAYELNNSKNALPGVRSDISDFESHVNSIQQAYIHILELNSNAEDRIRQEFKIQLDSKDSIIVNLQKTVSELKNSLEEVKSNSESKIETLTIENNSLNNEKTDILNRLNNAEKMIAEKDSIIFDKQTIIEKLNADVLEHKELKEINSKLEKELKIKSDSAVCTAARAETLEKQLKALTEEHEKELAITAKEHEADKKIAVLEAREQQQTKIEKQSETIAEYMKKNNELIEYNKKLEIELNKIKKM